MKYEEIVNELLPKIEKSQLEIIFSWEECELDGTFIGFVDNYYDLPKKIPKDWVIVDVGCYQALQAKLFENHKQYIGIDNVPIKYRLNGENIKHYNMYFQEFVKENIIKKLNLDLNKTFAISSAVPCKEANELIKKNFKFYKIMYPGEKTIEKLID